MSGIDRISGWLRGSRPVQLHSRPEARPSRRAFLAGAARFVGGTAIAAPIFNSLGCVGDSVPVLCDRTAAAFDPEGKILGRLMKTANMSVSGGVVRFSVDIPFSGRSDEAALGTMSVRLFSSPTSIAADFAGQYGLVPVGMIKVVKLPSSVVEGSDEARSYAVGGKMLKGKDGTFAVFSRMTTSLVEGVDAGGNPASVLKPVWEFTDPFDGAKKLVVETKDCEIKDIDSPCATSVKYLLVNADGTVSDKEVTGVNRDELIEAFSYYRVLPDGRYWDTNLDGSPKADQSLADKELDVVADENVTLRDIIDGNEKLGIWGLARNAAGKTDLSLIGDHVLDLTAKVTVVDMRNPSVGTKVLLVDPNGNIRAKDDAGSFIIPRELYSSGEFNFVVRVEFDSDGLNLPQVEYVYSAALDGAVSVRPDGSCE